MTKKMGPRKSAFIVTESVLAGRIAAGKAEPISDIERRIAAELRDDYVNRYGDAGLPVPLPQSTIE